MPQIHVPIIALLICFLAPPTLGSQTEKYGANNDSKFTTPDDKLQRKICQMSERQITKRKNAPALSRVTIHHKWNMPPESRNHRVPKRNRIRNFKKVTTNLLRFENYWMDTAHHEQRKPNSRSSLIYEGDVTTTMVRITPIFVISIMRLTNRRGVTYGMCAHDARVRTYERMRTDHANKW